MREFFSKFSPFVKLASSIFFIMIFVTPKQIIDNLYGSFTGEDNPPTWMESDGVKTVRLAFLVLGMVLLASFCWPFISVAWSAVFRKNPSPFSGRPRNLLKKMSGSYASVKNGIYELREGDQITTTEFFRPPVAFRVVAKTDSSNLRIGYIEEEIIFNWESNPSQLRIGNQPGSKKRGPFCEMHKRGLGRIPVNKWVTVDLVATKESLSIRVDGSPRFFEKANLSEIYEPFSVFQGAKSTVHVRSLLVGLPPDKQNNNNQGPEIQNKPSAADQRLANVGIKLSLLPIWAQDVLRYIAGPKGVLIEREAERWIREHHGVVIENPLAKINELTDGWLSVDRDMFRISPAVLGDLQTMFKS